MGLFGLFKKKEKNTNYLSGKEIRQIAKENKKIMNELERYKYRKASEDEFTTEMKDNKNILEIDDLHTYFFTEQGVVKAVNGVSFDIPKNATVGVVGESGCGKSVTSMSVMRLLQGPQGQIYSGSIRFKAYDYVKDENGNPKPVYETDELGNIVYKDLTDKKGNKKLDKEGKTIKVPVQKTDAQGVLQYENEEKIYDIAKMPINEIHRIRGKQIAMIFQEPMTSLNPIFTIGEQLDEVTFIHVPGATKEMAKAKSIEMLNLVGIAMPERVYNSYPHELSGGMRQRVMISMALACNPRLIIADEPTTALDVTIQAQILDLLRDLKTKIDGSILLITHDLGIIAEMADYVVVMYAGRVIEKGTVQEIFHNPLHPYTIGLQKSKPTLDSDSDTLFNIPGNVPNPVNMPNFCYFKERCSRCVAKCSGDYPGMVQVSPTHFVACHLYNNEKEIENG
ncbi:MAG: ABC transporter ATP-binding protein [Clostridia bacterium]|nr:ABC transporter ATP-binding protein [Clostridia bacterium]MBO5092042.1 ABC transporter ATP-binding protein [Clostridia bacterium]MBP3494642.1 ABC transporter ATP-binding protein [Clostridia bacterium]